MCARLLAVKRRQSALNNHRELLRQLHNSAKVSVANKLSRGTFPATFLLAVMKAIGRQNLDIDDVEA
jgi:hypothetical protein